VRLPIGVRDWLPAELSKKRGIERSLREAFTANRYVEIETPHIERLDTIAAGLGARMTRQTLRFEDRHAATLALRPEMTTPIARLVATRLREASLPLRLAYVAPVFRAEQPQEGRMCEFTQAGIELIGAPDREADAEVLLMAIATLDALHVGPLRFDINHVAVLEGLLAGCGLSGDEAEEIRHRLARRDLVALEQRLHDLPASTAQHLRWAGLARGGREMLERLAPICTTEAAQEGIARLAYVLERAAAAGYGDRVQIDLGLVRESGYYTGIVFEGYVDELGLPLCGGGRYDNLLTRFGYHAAAIGWTTGVERLLIAAERRERTAATPRQKQKKSDRLTIAVPKGALYADATARLAAAGIRIPSDPGRRLLVETEDGEADVLLLRPTDVPAYVEIGAADCGIVGKDVLWESDRSVCELADLGFGPCRLVVAGRRLDRYHEGAPLPTFFRAATKFVHSAESYFAERDLPVQIVPLHGSVELAPLVGLADVIVDLVATGATLREHDLVVIDEIDASTARFIVNPVRFRAKYQAITGLLRRLHPHIASEDRS